jgi:hypothetical protein
MFNSFKEDENGFEEGWGENESDYQEE